MKYPVAFDVIVIGGGHAGVEAALASARMGCKTLLLTHNIETIGQLSCNPSMGGIGKGQLMKEIDAMDGAMAWCADQAAIHMKVLNRSKGPAMHGHHGVLDRQLYRRAIRYQVEHQPNLSVFQQGAEDVLMQGDRIIGVKSELGIEFSCQSVVLTAGTFLNGRVHVGLQNKVAGRAGDPASIGLAERLKELKLPQGRLKTGTPARIDGRTIDFSQLTAQHSDDYEHPDRLPVFSFMAHAGMHPQQRACYSTHTNERTHEILRTGFDESPMFTGIIEGKGPRYCPSIEDKITRFAEKQEHPIMLEPEGLEAGEWYPNGISTSLPFHVQYEAIRSIRGLENAHLTRPGYAIEYDYYDPRALSPSLGLKAIQGLYLAGQCIGTTGYSEAAALGLVAGINDGRHALNQAPWIVERHEAYLGVMIDDLIHQGLTEPYRMYTSRSEYRLSLREDNADERLTEKGKELGVVSDRRYQHWLAKKEGLSLLKEKGASMIFHPKELNNDRVQEVLGQALTKETALKDVLKRPSVQWTDVERLVKDSSYETTLNTIQQDIQKGLKAQVPLSERVPQDQDIWVKKIHQEVCEQWVTQLKYAGYVKQQEEDIERHKKSMGHALPVPFDYKQIQALSTEVKIRLNEHQPSTVSQASRIPGVTPSALSIVMVYLKKQGLWKNNRNDSESSGPTSSQETRGLKSVGA